MFVIAWTLKVYDILWCNNRYFIFSSHIFQLICSTYFITAPSVFRPGQPLKLRVALSDAVTGPVDITCGIMDNNQKRLIVSGGGTFSKGELC